MLSFSFLLRSAGGFTHNIYFYKNTHIEGFLLSLIQVLFLFFLSSRAEFISKSAQIIDNYFCPILSSAAITIKTPNINPMIVPTMNPNTPII